MASNLYAEYEKTVKGKHYFKAMVGTNYEQSVFNRLDVQRNGLIFEDATNINLALGQAISTSGDYEGWKILGGFTRLNYIFNDKYLVEFNGRYDGSSKFPENERYALLSVHFGGLALVAGSRSGPYRSGSLPTSNSGAPTDRWVMVTSARMLFRKPLISRRCPAF